MSILLSSSWESFGKLISVLIIFVFVLAITYFTTRWMAGFTKARSNNKNLRVIETINVGTNKFVSIVEAGTKYLVISVGKDEVHILTELSREQLKDFSFEHEEPIKPLNINRESFQEILDKFKNKQ